MIKALLLATALLGAAALPAAAQSYDPFITGPRGPAFSDRGPVFAGGYDPRPRGEFRGPDMDRGARPGQWMRGLRYQGYFDVRILDDRGGMIVVRAAGRRGDQILTVDARSGEVLRRHPAGPGWGSDRRFDGPRGWGR